MIKYLMLAAAVLVGCLLLTCLPAVEAQRPKVEDSWAYGIWIFSPAANTTYTQNTLLLNVTTKRYLNAAYYDIQLQYSLNQGENVSIFTSDTFIQKPSLGIFGDAASYTLYSGTAALPPLAQGTYNLTVYAQYTRKEDADPKWPNMYDTQTVQFTVNLSVPPTVTLHPFNSAQKMVGDNVSVTFSVDEFVNWTSYSLDGQANVTVWGNFTLTNLAADKHNLTVYAMDQLGNVGTSETVHFAVAEPEQTQLWLPAAMAAVAVAVFGVVLFLY